MTTATKEEKHSKRKSSMKSSRSSRDPPPHSSSEPSSTGNDEPKSNDKSEMVSAVAPDDNNKNAAEHDAADHRDSSAVSSTTTMGGAIANATGRQKMMVIGVLIVVCMIGFIVYRRYSGSSSGGKKHKGKKGAARDEDMPEDGHSEHENGHAPRERSNNKHGKHVRWADEEGGNLLDEFDEQDALMEKMQMARDIENVLSQMDAAKQHMNATGSEISKTKNNMSGQFGERGESYDDDITSMESEQSLDTAFMMKADIDKKRQGMIQYSQELGKQQQQLSQRGSQLQMQYLQKQQEYENKYGVKYIPQRIQNAVASPGQTPGAHQPPSSPPPPPSVPREYGYPEMQQQPLAQMPRTPIMSGAGPGDPGRGPISFGTFPASGGG